MATLVTSIRLVARRHHFGAMATKKLSTSAMPNVQHDSKEVIVNYLDGKENGIAVIGFKRPDTRNAIGRKLASQALDAVSALKGDNNLRVLILRSLVPKVFSAGADLRERTKMDETEMQQFRSLMKNVLNEIESFPSPVISAIDGLAFGGGLELALATDIRIAAAEAKMGLVETKLAIIPGAGGTQRLPRVVGVAKAKELIYTAKVLDGDEAGKIGLVNHVVPQNKEGDAAYQAALSIAREILPNGPIGVRLAKVAISEGMDTSLENGLEIEAQCYDKLINTKDRVEGLAAFVAKRTPVYRGI